MPVSGNLYLTLWTFVGLEFLVALRTGDTLRLVSLLTNLDEAFPDLASGLYWGFVLSGLS